MAVGRDIEKRLGGGGDRGREKYRGKGDIGREKYREIGGGKYRGGRDRRREIGLLQNKS